MVDIKRTFDTILVEKENNALIDSQNPVGVRSRRTIYVKDNSVTQAYSLYRMGRRKDNGKLFGRWNTEDMNVIRRTPTGKVAFMTRTPTGVHGGPRFFPAMLGFKNDEVQKFYNDAVKNQLGISTLSDIYPVLGHFEAIGDMDFNRFDVINDVIMVMQRNAGKEIYSAGRQTTTNAATRMVYKALHDNDPSPLVPLITGHPYRKDIARALRRLNPSALLTARELSAVEPNLVAKALEVEAEASNASYWRRARLQRMFNDGLLSRPTFLRLFETVGPTCYYYIDTDRMLRQQFTPSEARAFMRNRDILNAHDELSERANSAKVEKYQKPIEYKPLIEKVNGVSVGKYKIVLANNGNEIKSWGTQMGHCIGSYSDSAYSTSVLGAVQEGGKMVANFQLTLDDYNDPTYRLVQIYGKHNRTFEGAQEIHDYLVENKVIVDSQNAGGMPRLKPNIRIDYNPIEWQDAGYAPRHVVQFADNNRPAILAGANLYVGPAPAPLVLNAN